MLDRIATSLALTKVRDILKSGWCQEHLAQSRVMQTKSPHQREATRFCIEGAIIRAEPTGGSVRDAVSHAIREALVNSTGAKHPSLTGWNDAYGRTQAEVLDLIQSAIDNVNKGPVTHDESSQTPA